MSRVSDLPMPRRPDLLTPEELDDMSDAELQRSVGRGVDTYVGVVGDVFRCKDGGIRVRVRLPCAKCGRRKTHYLSGGPHHGALCYVYDTNGSFLADLRNQQFVCDSHG